MPTTEHLHPLRSDKSRVDATFELSSVAVFELVYHHKAGARDSARSVNADYHEGLELLLARLASIGTTILRIAVDSGKARELPEADRELVLPFPIVLDGVGDLVELRKDITRAQKAVARRPGAKPGGGNDQKRILLTLECHGSDLSLEELREVLIG